MAQDDDAAQDLQLLANATITYCADALKALLISGVQNGYQPSSMRVLLLQMLNSMFFDTDPTCAIKMMRAQAAIMKATPGSDAQQLALINFAEAAGRLCRIEHEQNQVMKANIAQPQATCH